MKCPEMALRVKEKYAKAKAMPTMEEQNAAKLEIKRNEIECLEAWEKDQKADETPEDRRKRQFREIHDCISLKKIATVEIDREWARRHIFTEPFRVSQRDVPARSSVVCLLMALDDPVFRRGLFTVEKQPQEVKTNGQQGSNQHLRDILGQIPEQGRPGGSPGSGEEQGVPAVGAGPGGTIVSPGL